MSESESASEDDLSGGALDRIRRDVEEAYADEEAERRKWKTRLFRIASVLSVIFYLVLLDLILGQRKAIAAPHVVITLALVPTALLFGLLRMVAKPVKNQPDDDEIPSPALKLFKEALELIRSK